MTTKYYYTLVAMFAVATVATPAAAQSLFDLNSAALEGYGGPHFRATVLNGKPTLLGGGLIAIGGAAWRDETTGSEEASVVVFIEPEVLAELNLATFVRLTVGVTYRGAFTLDELRGLGISELSAPAATVQIRFGWF